MAKFKFYVSTNYVGSEIEEIVEIPDEEIEGMDEMKKDRYINEEYYKPWLFENINAGYHEDDE